MSDEWLEQILEKFNPSDYEEYHQSDHSYGQPKYDRWDREYMDYMKERRLQDIKIKIGRRKKSASSRLRQRQLKARRPR